MFLDVEVAARAGVPLRVLRAIAQIESGNDPRSLRFETRIFERLTGQTVAGSGRAAFNHAYSINPAAAVKSSSWGLYQVLGTPLLSMFGDPATAVRSFYADPVKASQRLVIAFFNARPAAQQAANTGDWAALARLYNGSDQTPWLGRFEAAYARASGSSWAGAILGAVGAIAGGSAAWYARFRRRER